MRTRTLQARYEHVAANGTTTQIGYEGAPVGTVVKSKPGKLRITLMLLNGKTGTIAVRSSYPGRAQAEQVVRQAKVVANGTLVAEFDVAEPSPGALLFFTVAWTVDGDPTRRDQTLVWMPLPE